MEIHIQQSHINKPTIPTCYYQLDHQQQCICSIRKYPWHNLDRYIIDKKGDSHIPLYNYLDHEI